MTSKTQLKRLCVQDPIGMDERMHRLEKELFIVRENLARVQSLIMRGGKVFHGEDVASAVLEKDPA